MAATTGWAPCGTPARPPTAGSRRAPSHLGHEDWRDERGGRACSPVANGARDGGQLPPGSTAARASVAAVAAALAGTAREAARAIGSPAARLALRAAAHDVEGADVGGLDDGRVARPPRRTRKTTRLESRRSTSTDTGGPSLPAVGRRGSESSGRSNVSGHASAAGAPAPTRITRAAPRRSRDRARRASSGDRRGGARRADRCRPRAARPSRRQRRCTATDSSFLAGAQIVTGRETPATSTSSAPRSGTSGTTDGLDAPGPTPSSFAV